MDLGLYWTNYILHGSIVDLSVITAGMSAAEFVYDFGFLALYV